MSRDAGWRLEFWRDRRGRAPVDEFIRGLDPKMQIKVQRNVDLLRAEGPDLKMPLARPVVGHEFSELRVQTGGNSVRIFYFFFTGRRIVFLHGFLKKSQKTPAAELAVAARRMAEYRGII